MNGIFISHSTKNKKLVEQVMELLQLGMGIGRNHIFCTSLYDALPTGENFTSIIKEKMRECGIVMAVITPEYLESKFCVMELGAAWMQVSHLCLILAGGVDYKDLDDTPLKNLQMRKIEKEADWYAIYDEMVKCEVSPGGGTLLFHTQLERFMKQLDQMQVNGSEFIYPDSDGYYQVTVVSLRKVPEPYRCYEIGGRLVLKEEKIEEVKEESHWIFFKAGVYDDLKKGDRVRLKAGKTERKCWRDIGWARNVYPDELELL